MSERATRPAGGFCFIPAMALLAAWTAYKRGSVRYLDLRVWISCHELVARRCGMSRGRVPRFTAGEVQRLVRGRSLRAVRESVRRLERAGLLRWSAHALSVPPFTGDHVPAETLALVANHRRKVPVPRRVVRFLAACGRPVLLATTLGHLLRCMYYRNGRCSPKGLCKASWVADTFGVDERNVKAARAELVRAGLLVRSQASQFVLNRWGVPMRLNVEWGGGALRTVSPPPRAPVAAGSPPPRRTGNSLPRSEHQEPGRPVRSGVRTRTGREPWLGHVVEADLADPTRTQALFEQACKAGLVRRCESDRLKVFAAAEHARALANRNAPGLFATVLRLGLWRFLTLGDEDRARAAMRRVPVPDAPRPERLESSVAVPIHAAAEVRALVARSLRLAEEGERGRDAA